jgi:hypothetical protein
LQFQFFQKGPSANLLAIQRYIILIRCFKHLRPKGPLDKPEEIEGQALEGLVAQSLRA